MEHPVQGDGGSTSEVSGDVARMLSTTGMLESRTGKLGWGVTPLDYYFFMIYKIFDIKADKNPASLNHFIYFYDPVPAEDVGGSHGQGEGETELLLVLL